MAANNFFTITYKITGVVRTNISKNIFTQTYLHLIPLITENSITSFVS